MLTVEDFQFPRFGKFNTFAHMAVDFIKQHLNRHAVDFSQVEGSHRFAENFLARCRCQSDGRMVAMGAPFGLHDIGLARAGRHTCGRSTAHDINDYAGNLGNASIADQFLLEGDTGAGAGGQSLGTGEGCAKD